MDILSSVAGAVTPALAYKVAGAFGVPEAAVWKVMAVGIPVILASLMKRGSAAGGVDAIASSLDVVRKNPLDGLGEDTGHATRVSSVAQGGSDMLRFLLGAGTSNSLVRTLAGHAGIDEKAAGPILGLASSAALGGLKSASDKEGLDAGGIMRLLGTQKDQINGAIPQDLGRLLSTSGILPQAADMASAARASIPSAPVPAQSGGWMKWALAALALAAIAWLGTQFFGRTPAPVVTEAPASAPAAADLLVVDGVNIGESLQSILGDLTETLAGVTDTASATAAVEALTNADTALGGLQTAVNSLSGAGKPGFQALIAGALPALKTTMEGLLGDSAISAILKPALDSILAKLTTLGG